MAKVESIGKFGFVADGKKYRYDEVSINRASIVPGAEVEFNTVGQDMVAMAPSGAVALANDLITAAVDTERARKFTPKYVKVEETKSAGMSKDEWAQKDRRISRQGCIQVAVQVMSDFEAAKELAEKMLEFVNS